ncbi:peptidoglycan glycosyltransferase [Abditibacterium utsteinense]|uniref:Peptidoglycan glycosyltransferase n=1 Tax=Abditibacterium utsteinense TaxID=1960156 RepID=A0A2S8SUZ8_9BACT|nr:penicillin-binding protein 2 [Abditibacterium utsteinense]PQV64612.1 peptidoglycan glycosyltransferase [Abditibacterium utsteinense]
MATILPPSSKIRDTGAGWDVADAPKIRRRALTTTVFLGTAFFALLARLWYLQVVEGSQFMALAQHNRIARVPFPAPRGLILDRRGAILATSRSLHSVALVPGTLPSKKREAAQRTKLLGTLSFLLGTSSRAIEAQLTEASEKGGRFYDPVTIAEDVDLKTITLIEENRPRLGSSVLITDDLKRLYPQGSLAAHVLGYTGLVTRRDLSRAEEAGEELKFDDKIGKSGLERQYNALLMGERGAQEYEVDARGRPQKPRGRVEDIPGATLRLTLDLKLQRAAETALAKARNNGAIAAIDPRNGAVLALASRPTFNPNIFSLPKKQFNPIYRQIVANPGHPLLDRPVVSRFPPGSTFKLITASAGLEQGSITPGTMAYCSGGMRLGRFFGCWGTHGATNLSHALAISCDVYFYQAALKMGNPESSGPTYLATVARRFGLGRDTGIDLPSDEAGLVPDPAWRAKINKTRPDLARWFPGNTLNMSIGQGDVLATPLQMALATGAVANGGTLWKPHILGEAVDKNGKVLQKIKPSGESVGISAKNLAIVRQGLRDVVTKGTGKACAMPNVNVAGKTGSAEDVHNVLPHSWWVCYAPAEKPTIAIAVMIENAGHGSTNALPVAKAVLEAAFPLAPKTKIGMKKIG